MGTRTVAQACSWPSWSAGSWGHSGSESAQNSVQLSSTAGRDSANTIHPVVSNISFVPDSRFNKSLLQCRGWQERHLHCPRSDPARHQKVRCSRHFWHCLRDAEGACLDGPNRTAVYLHPPGFYHRSLLYNDDFLKLNPTFPVPAGRARGERGWPTPPRPTARQRSLWGWRGHRRVWHVNTSFY